MTTIATLLAIALILAAFAFIAYERENSNNLKAIIIFMFSYAFILFALIKLYYIKEESKTQYQMKISNEGTDIYDGERYIGFTPLDTTAAIDKLLIKDNE